MLFRMAWGLSWPLFAYVVATAAEPARPIVIAHRGASGYLPEHTLESKALAIGMGTDFVEQDIVLTKDDVPIVSHDIHLDRVTDIATRFPHRGRADGRFYAIDFTWAEIQQLQVTERLDKTGQPVFPQRFLPHTGRFRIASLAEELTLIQGLNRSAGREVGIYPELKQPKFHREAGKDLSSIVMRTLAEFGYTGRDARCFVQCFELDEVRRLRQELHCELPLICLLSKDKEWAALLADDASLRQRLRELAGFSEGVGPHLELVVAGASPEGLPRLTAFVRAARETGLQVHGWTFRADQLECGAQSFAQLHEWGRVAGLDGYFSDFPDQTLKYLQQSQQR